VAEAAFWSQIVASRAMDRTIVFAFGWFVLAMSRSCSFDLKFCDFMIFRFAISEFLNFGDFVFFDFRFFDFAIALAHPAKTHLYPKKFCPPHSWLLLCKPLRGCVYRPVTASNLLCRWFVPARRGRGLRWNPNLTPPCNRRRTAIPIRLFADSMESIQRI
jgi:hypothetical protein